MSLGSNAYNTAQTTTYNVAAGATLDIAATGTFVRCTASSLASFGLKIDGGPTISFAQGLGLKTPVGHPYSLLTIDNTGNSSALNVTLAYGQGDMTDNRLGNPFVQGASVLVGSKFGGSFNNQGNLALNTVVTIFTAAQNVNGAWLRTVNGSGVVATSTSVVQFTSGAVAPANGNFTSNPVVFEIGNAYGNAPRDIFIPPGQGLYVQTNVAASVANCTFDLL